MIGVLTGEESDALASSIAAFNEFSLSNDGAKKIARRSSLMFGRSVVYCGMVARCIRSLALGGVRSSTILFQCASVFAQY